MSETWAFWFIIGAYTLGVVAGWVAKSVKERNDWLDR